MYSTIILLCLITTLYFVIVWTYRLFLSPICHFPGPRLAALTFWYEGYYDVMCDGRYTWRIKEMHERYGPVVRINPCELHVSDAEFYHSIYVGSGRRTDKWFWSARMFGTNDAIVGTTDHQLHHSRKNALAPFFSKVAVSRMESLIQDKVDKLCARLLEFSGREEVVNLSDAFTAFSADVIGSYVFGLQFGFLDDKDFSPDWRTAMVELSRSTHLMKQFGWASPVLNRVVDSWIGATLATLYSPLKFLSHIRKSTREAIEAARGKVAQADSSEKGNKVAQEKPKEQVTSVLESLLSSTAHQLPAPELSTARLMDEAITILGAGSVTTAQTLTAALYFILATPRIESKLRTELATVYATNPRPTWSQLSQLPYLTAVLNEALRLSYGVSSRLPRISPDMDLVLPSTSRDGRDLVIPRGTPVSMTQMFLHDDPAIFRDPLTFEPERWIRRSNSSDGDDHADQSSPHSSSPASDEPHHKNYDPTTTTVSGNNDDPDDPAATTATATEQEELQKMRKYFVPFSRGSRACLGTQLAWAELYCCIAALFKPDHQQQTETLIDNDGSNDGMIRLGLFKTEEKEVRVEHDYFNGAPEKGCIGVRVLVR